MAGRVTRKSDPAYPTLEDFACERRGFLRRLFVGAVTLGVGGRALSACTSSVTIDGETAHPDLHSVRLPGSGFASAYIGYEEYVHFAVTFNTYNEAFAAWYRSNEAEGLGVLAAALTPFGCSDLSSGMTAVRTALAVALEDHYLSLHDDEGPLVNSIEAIVDSCEYMPPIGGGVAEDPHYP
jgi:hypothetical protein